MPLLSISLDAPQFAALDGAAIVSWPSTVWQVRGPAAVACLQGVVTADVAGPGETRLAYGAFLTPKGMIITDAWILRRGDEFRIAAPAASREALAALFGKMMPPRLARTTELPDAGVRLLVGREAVSQPGAEPGQVLEATEGAWVARPSGRAPFSAIAIGSTAALDGASTMWQAGGASPAESVLGQAWRILTGWPALGAEIGEKTLPQEVRFDEHDGVSYNKGCYTGQETVARLHFRGHANRALRGLALEGEVDPDQADLWAGEKRVGAITSELVAPSAHVGLGLVRREVGIGDELRLGGARATVVDLPIGRA